ncbi:MAG: hypothetical protein M0026_01090 [Nocardiopsaceae bacterium]|nr:hypothetical protein [Nocardiopsaceae bacterium]
MSTIAYVRVAAMEELIASVLKHLDDEDPGAVARATSTAQVRRVGCDRMAMSIC